MMLRDYQLQAIHDLRRSIATGHWAPVLYGACGMGKSRIMAEIIRSAREKEQQVLALNPRRELVYQLGERLDAVGVEYAMLMAGEEGSLFPWVQVASTATLHARAMQRQRIDLPRGDVCIVDESHIFGNQTKALIEHYKQQGSVIIGMTATPAKASGEGLGEMYDDLVMGPSIPELVEKGWLVPARYFTGESPDLTGIKIHGGDYQQKELGKRADQPKLIGDIVTNWLRIAGDRPTFVFTVNVAHSRHLADEFRSVGVAAEHLDGTTDLEERKAIQQRFRDGETQVLTNCQVMTYGIDIPSVSCIVMACPTKSITKYFQAAGRGLRPSPGKEDLILIDHGNIVHELGFIDDEMPWTLDGKEKIQERKQSLSPEPQDITCGDCGQVFRPRKTCPGCGKDMTSKAKKAIEAHEAELVEIDKRKKKKAGKEYSAEYKARFYGELLGYARQKGYKRGWCYYAYKAKFSCGPGGQINHAPVMEPGDEVLRWIKHLQIKRAKAKQKERAAA